jgi:hypothetical protein
MESLSIISEMRTWQPAPVDSQPGPLAAVSMGSPSAYNQKE